MGGGVLFRARNGNTRPGHGSRVPVEVFTTRYNVVFVRETLSVKNKQKRSFHYGGWSSTGKRNTIYHRSRDYGPNRAAIYYRTRTHARGARRHRTHSHTDGPVIAAHIYRFSWLRARTVGSTYQPVWRTRSRRSRHNGHRKAHRPAERHALPAAQGRSRGAAPARKRVFFFFLFLVLRRARSVCRECVHTRTLANHPVEGYVCVRQNVPHAFVTCTRRVVTIDVRFRCRPIPAPRPPVVFRHARRSDRGPYVCSPVVGGVSRASFSKRGRPGQRNGPPKRTDDRRAARWRWRRGSVPPRGSRGFSQRESPAVATRLARVVFTMAFEKVGRYIYYMPVLILRPVVLQTTTVFGIFEMTPFFFFFNEKRAFV